MRFGALAKDDHRSITNSPGGLSVALCEDHGGSLSLPATGSGECIVQHKLIIIDDNSDYS